MSQPSPVSLEVITKLSSINQIAQGWQHSLILTDRSQVWITNPMNTHKDDPLPQRDFFEP